MSLVVTEFSEQDALTAKIISMVTLFGISMACGSLPFLISLKYDWFTKSNGSDIRTSNRLVMALLAFGGGVLFSMTFMHLLHEVNENIDLLQEEGELAEMPFYLAGLIMSAGFFMMYLIEELVHLYIDSRQKKNAGDFTRAFSIRRSITENSQSEALEPKEKVEVHHTHVPMSMGPVEEDGIMAALRGLLVVLALSIHELFEGIAVGLESSTANVWFMFAAVSAHKYIIAFCVGVELLATGTKRWLSLVYIFTFSFMSALGIGIGILLVGGAGATEAGIYSVVLQGLACGTLVYVVFFEVWRRDGSGLAQFFWAFVGYVVMFGLGLVVDIAIGTNV